MNKSKKDNSEQGMRLSQSKLNEFIISNFPRISVDKTYSVLNDDVFEADIPEFLNIIDDYDKKGLYKKYGVFPLNYGN